MSNASDFDIDHIAQLARIELTPEERTTFATQLGDFLQHIDQLKKVDVSNVEPTSHGFPIYNVWQEDEAAPCLPVDAALQNAPKKRDNMFVVPKVVE